MEKEQDSVTETTSGEQIEIWKEELTRAMAGQQWRRALQLCSWLRYALWQQGRSDLEVEGAQRQAKDALAEQVTREETQQGRDEEHRRQRRQIMHQIVAGDWEQALDSIEAFYRDRASQREAVHLLQELKRRLGSRLNAKYRHLDRRSAALGLRFDRLAKQIHGDPSLGQNQMKKGLRKKRMDEHLTGTRKEFETWIRDTIGGDFRWKVRPRDAPSKRKMIADLILSDMESNDGVFPGNNVFIERVRAAPTEKENR